MRRRNAIAVALAMALAAALACDRDGGGLTPPVHPPAERPVTPDGDDEQESQPAAPIPPAAGGPRTGAPAAIGEAPDRPPGPEYPPVADPPRGP